MRLKEWLDANGNKVSTGSTGNASTTSSGSFKKRLNKLITYYGQHLPAGIDYINVGLLTNDTLNFVEHYDTGSKAEFKIYIGPTTEAWSFKVWTDGKPTDDLSGMGWTELLKTLRAYITVPVTGTPEYKGLLTEWVDSKGKKVSLNNFTSTQSTSNTKSQKERYKKLIAQIDADGIAKYKVNELTDTVLDFNVSTKYKPAGYRVKIEYSSTTDDFILQVADGTALKGNDWNEDILTLLGVGAVLRETDNLRDSYSLADDFRLYENLWD